MDDMHIHVWTWDDERPGYSKCKECFIRKNEEVDECDECTNDHPFLCDFHSEED